MECEQWSSPSSPSHPPFSPMFPLPCCRLHSPALPSLQADRIWGSLAAVVHPPASLPLAAKRTPRGRDGKRTSKWPRQSPGPPPPTCGVGVRKKMWPRLEVGHVDSGVTPIHQQHRTTMSWFCPACVSLPGWGLVIFAIADCMMNASAGLICLMKLGDETASINVENGL